MEDTLKSILKALQNLQFLLAIILILMIIILCSSCSRSTVRFKGQGDIEYIYRGQNGPDLVVEK